MPRFIVTVARHEMYVIDGVEDEETAKATAIEMYQMDNHPPEVVDISEDPAFAVETPTNGEIR